VLLVMLATCLRKIVQILLTFQVAPELRILVLFGGLLKDDEQAIATRTEGGNDSG
jgi:hypothetical protein